MRQLLQARRRQRRLRLGEGLVRLGCWWGTAAALIGLSEAAAIAVAVLGFTVEGIRWRRTWWSDDQAAVAADNAGRTGGLVRTALAVGQGRAHGSAGMGQVVVERADARVTQMMPEAVQRFRVPWVATLCLAVALALVVGLFTERPPTIGSLIAGADGELPADAAAAAAKARRSRSEDLGGHEDAGTSAAGGSTPRDLDERTAATGSRREGVSGAKGGQRATGAAGAGGRPGEGSLGDATRTGSLAEAGADATGDDVNPTGGARKRSDRQPDADHPAKPPEAVAAGSFGGPRDKIERTKEDIDERMLFADGDFGRKHGDTLGEREAEDLLAGLAPNMQMAMVGQDSEVAAPGIGGVNDSSGTSLAMTSADRLADTKAAEQWVETAWQESAAGTVQTIEGGQSGGRSTLAYQRIFAQYAAIAESAVRAEPIPPTRRHYIRRYFDAIRPEKDMEQ